MLVAPLPDASALVVFRNLAAEAATAAGAQAALEASAGAQARDAALGELAFEQLLLPVEAAVQKLMAAIPTAASPAAFQALGAAAQGLKDGLARARELRALAEAPAAEGPLPELAAALAARRHALAAPPEAAAWAPELRRVALALGLAAADLAEPGAAVSLTMTTTPGTREILRRDACRPARRRPRGRRRGAGAASGRGGRRPTADRARRRDVAPCRRHARGRRAGAAPRPRPPRLTGRPCACPRAL